MRLLFVVQRYGPEVAGGAEALARMLATRLVPRGHEVTVLTSCARDYDTWADHYEPGTTVEDGVRIVRLPVVRPRDPERFTAATRRVLPPDRAPSALAERAWVLEEGPHLRGFVEVLREEAARHDAVDFFTYLYATTLLGMEALHGATPTVLHPAAHDEWPLRLRIVRSAFDRADALACSTVEELELVRRRFRPRVPAEVVGIGFDPPAEAPDPERFRAQFDLADRPYVLCLGRIDPNKGADEAMALVRRYRERHGSDLTLVMCGAPMMPIEPWDGLVVTGFVDDRTRWDALTGAAVLLQPSRQESFGMTIAEAWLVGRPALVRAQCDVTAGLVARSGGGLTYGDEAEFDAALGVLLDPAVGDRLGALGRAHVGSSLTWDRVLDAYESLVERAVASAG